MKKQKKILIFSDCFTYSGSELVIENILLSKKIANNFDLEFIYGYNPSYDSRLKERFDYLNLKLDNVKSIRLISPDWYGYQKSLLKKTKSKYFYLLLKTIILKIARFLFISHVLNFFLLRKEILTSNPDILYINNGGYPASLQCLLTVFVARSIGISTIYFNINNMAMNRKRWYDSYIDSYINGGVTKFITASYAAQKQAIISRNFVGDLFVRIPNTIYNDEGIKIFNDKNENRKIIKFGSVGLLTERKGYHVLLKALDILVNRCKITDFEVEIIGDGEERQNLENLVNEFNLNNFVRFLGFQSNPLSFISDFDVFILPSVRNEDFPYVILEAMILSKPIIGTTVAGIPEQIINEETGLLIEPNNPDDLAIAMEKC